MSGTRKGPVVMEALALVVFGGAAVVALFVVGAALSQWFAVRLARWEELRARYAADPGPLPGSRRYLHETIAFHRFTFRRTLAVEVDGTRLKFQFALQPHVFIQPICIPRSDFSAVEHRPGLFGYPVVQARIGDIRFSCRGRRLARDPIWESDPENPSPGG